MTQDASPSLRQALRDRSIAIVGMNGVGKTVFGKKLASALEMQHADSDKLFQQRHGDAHKFIETRGWDEYRLAEEPLILASLLPGHIAILSGGAVESPAVRKALRDHSIVIWLQASPKRIHTHLQRAKVARPEFSDGLHHARVESLAEARNPHYEEVADIALFPSTPFARQVPVVLAELEKFLRKNPR